MPFNKDQEVYKRLRGIVSERTSSVIVWCGAGVSIPAGLPDWRRLREVLTSALHQKAANLADDAGKKLLATGNAIAREEGPWIAIERLERALGKTTFTDTVREALRPASSAPIPAVYSMLWKLRPAGLLNLNLDRLATRAYYDVNGPKHLRDFTSAAVGANTPVLQGLHPFVYNLHGVHEDASSWVLTHSRLRALFRDPAYLNFISTALSTHIVIFVGLSAEDVAVGGHLSRLSLKGIDTGPHYWLSPRADQATDTWAEARGIRLVPYRNTDGTHQELAELLTDLVSYVPPEAVPGVTPVVATVGPVTGALPSPADLARCDAETIRVALNSRARELLLNDTQDQFRAFEEFVNAYDEAVHGAWYVSLQHGQNKLFGYTLVKEVARGAFGRVFKAVAEDGAPVAIKMLHSNLREQHDLLLAFRRGVRSMAILHEHGLTGVVKYRGASEIPAMVAMDWIEGANLNEAVMANQLSEWQSILRVAIALARIINDAHSLPERVLHRDIRPSNVMLEGFWTEDDWKVVVLDFDLSWHRGAYEQSVTYGSGTAGYLAPEQIVRHKDESARHAAVDSFGLGMTLFFLVTRVDPLPAQHRHTNWRSSLEQAANAIQKIGWRSLPRRYARLIEMSTVDRQAGRLDLGQIVVELERLEEAVKDPRLVRGPDMLAEEIAVRAQYLIGFEWDEDTVSASVERPTGLCCKLAGDYAKNLVGLTIEWSTRGNDDWKQVSKKLADAARAAHSALEKAGWRTEAPDLQQYHFTLRASVYASGIGEQIDTLVVGLDKALSCLRFE